MIPSGPGYSEYPDKKNFPLSPYAQKLFLIVGAIFTVGLLIVVGTYLYFSSNLPRLDSLSDYRPPIVTNIYSAEGEMMAEYYKERRYVIPYGDIPPRIIQGFVSSEDGSFFRHSGINFMRIIQAMVENLKARKFVQGASTITQQVAKTMLLSNEKKIARKVKEAILASRMEKTFSKEQILYLYLNQIYLGHGAYGIEAASRTYFRKSVKDLTLAEAALISGLPQAPSRYDPHKYPDRAKKRQAYVLRRMVDEGYISSKEADEAYRQPMKIYKAENITRTQAPHYSEFIRRYLSNAYTEDKTYSEGFQVFSSCNLKLQKVAQEGIRIGLLQHDKRQGWRGPLEHLPEKDWPHVFFESKREALQAQVGHSMIQGRPLTGLPKTEEEGAPPTTVKDSPEETEEAPERTGDQELAYLEWEWLDQLPADQQKLYSHIGKTPLEPSKMYKAVVLEVEKAKAVVQVGDVKGTIPLEDTRWARKPDPEQFWEWQPIGSLTQALQKGDVVFVSLKKLTKDEVVFNLEQEPKAEAALLSMDIPSGNIRAMVGGYDFNRSEFNRALQAIRQPGSTFKPLIYASGIDRGLTPATIIVDSPITYRDEDQEFVRVWKPDNFGQKFYGDTTYRDALINSRNIASIKIVQELGIPYVTDYARHLGITTPLNQDLSIALGSSSVYLHELIEVYALFPNGGKRVAPVFVQRITNRDGVELLNTAANGFDPTTELLKSSGPGSQTTPPPTSAENPDETPTTKKPPPYTLFSSDDPNQIISPQTAYIMTDLLKGVVEEGTATAVKGLGKTLAGKTGTTNDYIDAWFMGFTPQMVSGVWMGFDEKQALGRLEVGGRAALPIWAHYMKEALKGQSYDDFKSPPGVTKWWIDSENGKKAGLKTKKKFQAAFLNQTEPGGPKAVPYLTSLKDYLALTTGKPGENPGGTAGSTDASNPPPNQNSDDDDEQNSDEDFYRKEMGQ